MFEPGHVSARGIPCESWYRKVKNAGANTTFDVHFLFPINQWLVAREDYHRCAPPPWPLPPTSPAPGPLAPKCTPFLSAFVHAQQSLTQGYPKEARDLMPHVSEACPPRIFPVHV